MNCCCFSQSSQHQITTIRSKLTTAALILAGLGMVCSGMSGDLFTIVSGAWALAILLYIRKDTGKHAGFMMASIFSLGAAFTSGINIWVQLAESAEDEATAAPEESSDDEDIERRVLVVSATTPVLWILLGLLTLYLSMQHSHPAEDDEDGNTVLSEQEHEDLKDLEDSTPTVTIESEELTVDGVKSRDVPSGDSNDESSS